ATRDANVAVADRASSAVSATAGWFRPRVTLQRAIAIGDTTCAFPVGVASARMTVSVTFHSVTAAGEAAVRSSSDLVASRAGSGIDTARDDNQSWIFEINSGTVATCDITLNFAGIIDAAATPTAFVMRFFDNFTEIWSAVAATPSANSIIATGVTLIVGKLYFIATGNQLIDYYVVSASSPQLGVTSFTTTVAAQDILNVAVTDN